MFSLLLTYSLLCASAFAAGVVNSLAGGGTLLTFPSLLHTGMLSKVANETSTVALVPGSVAGAWGFRRDLQGARHWLVLLIAPSLAGGLVGGWGTGGGGGAPGAARRAQRQEAHRHSGEPRSVPARHHCQLTFRNHIGSLISVFYAAPGRVSTAPAQRRGAHNAVCGY